MILTDGMEDETKMINRENYILMKKEEWNEYQGSPSWYRLKDQRMKIAGYKCEGGCCCDPEYGCNETENLEMHHETYPENPRDDCVENVRILCRNCHQDEYFYEENRYNMYLFDEACAKDD